MDYLPTYKIWLANRQYSRATIRNYLVDFGKYLSFLPSTDTQDIFSSEHLSSYISSISSSPNLNRYLSALNCFFEYALDQNLVSQNPLKPIIKKFHRQAEASTKTDLNQLVKLYQQYLIKKNVAPATIKNYINDLHQYINWLSISNLDT